MCDRSFYRRIVLHQGGRGALSALLRWWRTRCGKETDPSSRRRAALVAVIEPPSTGSGPVAASDFAVPSRLASALSACRSASSPLPKRANHLDRPMLSSFSVLEISKPYYSTAGSKLETTRPTSSVRFLTLAISGALSPDTADEIKQPVVWKI